MKQKLVQALAIATAFFAFSILANANEFEIDCEITILDRNFKNASSIEFQLIDIQNGNKILESRTEANGEIQFSLLPGIYEIKFKSNTEEFVYKFEIKPNDKDYNLTLRLPLANSELSGTGQTESSLSMSFDESKDKILTENIGRKNMGGIPLHEITPTLRDLANNSKIRP